MKLLLVVVTLLSTLSAFSIQYPISLDKPVEVSHKKTYSLGYSEEDEQALWVMYYLTSNQLTTVNRAKRKDDFRVDTNITTRSASPKDYKNTGLDKGHLCPAQDRSYSADAISETFLMSNMSPQDQKFNRGIWKSLEEYTRDYAISNGNVFVITGPVIFKRHNSIKNNVSIPQMYYKILVNTNKNEVVAYLLPNQDSVKDINDYIVDINYVETLTGLQFGIFW